MAIPVSFLLGAWTVLVVHAFWFHSFPYFMTSLGVGFLAFMIWIDNY